MAFEQYPPGTTVDRHTFFATVAEMVAATTQDGEQAHTSGYTTASDGGGSASGYTYHSTGRPTADGGFSIDGAGADDWFEKNDQSVANVAQFGAVGNDDGTGTTGTDDHSAIQAAVDSGAKTVRSHWSGKRYRISDSIKIWSTHNGITLDFGNDWLDVTDAAFSPNAAVQVINGEDAAGVPVDFAKIECNIDRLNIDGHWDYDGYATEVNGVYNTASSNDTVQVLESVQTDAIALAKANVAYGVNSINGLEYVVRSAGTGLATDAFFRDCKIGTLRLRNFRKSGFAITNPERCSIDTVIGYGSGGHSIVTAWDALEGDVTPGQGSLTIQSIIVERAGTIFDFASNVPNSTTMYPLDKTAMIHVGTIVARKIMERTKVFGPWDVVIDSMVIKDREPGNKNAAIDIAGTSMNSISIGTLNTNGYGGSYTAPLDPPAGWERKIVSNIGTLIHKDQDTNPPIGKLFRVVGQGSSKNPTYVRSLELENVQLVSSGVVGIDRIEWKNNLDEPAYWSNNALNYPFNFVKGSYINGGVIHDTGFGSTPPSYMFFLNDESCHISNLVTSASSTDGTISPWPAATPVTTGDYATFQASLGSVPQLWQSNATRTTGATFDAPEQAFWDLIGQDGRINRLAFAENATWVSTQNTIGNGFCYLTNIDMTGVWDRDFVQAVTTTLAIIDTGTRNIRFSSQRLSVPTAGTYSTPLRFWYPNPAAAAPMGARLVSNGTPGTWEEFSA